MIGVRFHQGALVGLTTALFAAGCTHGADVDDLTPVPPGEGSAGSGAEAVTGFQVTPLVTNQTDADLINPWGMCAMQGLFWIGDNGTGKVSVFDAGGRTSPDHPTGQFSLGAPLTGAACVMEANNAAFAIPCDSGETFGPADLVFSTENGLLIAVNSQTPPEGVHVVDLSSTGADFKGVTRVDMSSGPVLLAADFVNARVDMFDANFKQVTPTASPAPFNDPQLPAGWGPFNVLTRGDHVYVMEAKIGTGGDEEHGPGLGAVAVFDLNGTMLSRITSTSFNAPWGLDIAPASSTLTQGTDTLFIGNFGDGHITAFNTADERELGQLTDTSGNALVIDGLWSLVTGSAAAGNTNTLYFTAGPQNETAGEFGTITRIVSNTGGNDTDDTGSGSGVDTSDTGSGSGVDTSDL